MAKQIKAPQHRTLPAPPSTRTSCNAANAETKDLIRKFSLSHTHNATSPVDDDAHTVRTVKWKVRQPAHIEIIVTEKSEPVEKMDVQVRRSLRRLPLAIVSSRSVPLKLEI
jgi:hypothetical protein